METVNMAPNTVRIMFIYMSSGREINTLGQIL